MQYTLKIQFTLHVLPEKELVYHHTSVVALVDARKPPTFADASPSSG